MGQASMSAAGQAATGAAGAEARRPSCGRRRCRGPPAELQAPPVQRPAGRAAGTAAAERGLPASEILVIQIL